MRLTFPIAVPGGQHRVIAFVLALGLFVATFGGLTSSAAAASGTAGDEQYEPTTVDDWIGVLLDITAEEVARNGARPTVISRITYITTAAMYDAWAAYDDRAVPTALDPRLHPPRRERTQENQEIAIAHAAYRAMLDQYPADADQLRQAMVDRGLDPDDGRRDRRSPQGIGNSAADAVIASRRDDGSNQLGDAPGSDGTPYSDYTGYQPVNTVDEIVDPDRWQPITFRGPDEEVFTPTYLTPHWGEVTPFGLDAGDQFRPGPPPLVGSGQLEREVEQVLEENADLTLDEKAIVEFMRDGPQSTSQSGQWLTFARVVSRRDRHDLDRDMTMYFGLGVVGLDAFIGSWEAKRFYDSSRPWTLIRHLYAGQQVRGWGGPGEGTVTLAAEDWNPYSPFNFITPPFPGYVSGHSTVSGGSARFLELFTGSDRFGYEELWTVGALTEPGIPCAQIQRSEGQPPPPDDLSCEVLVELPTFTATAEMAGFSRVLGGFHIQADNVAGLVMGRQIAQHDWDVIQSYVDGSIRR